MCSVIFVVFVIFMVVLVSQTTSEVNSIKLKVVNYAGSPIQVFWINTFSAQRELVAQTSKPLRNNTDASINTYETHQFSIRWLKHIPGVDFNFTMGASDETRVVRFDESAGSFMVEREDSRTEIISIIEEKINRCVGFKAGSSKQELKKCLVQNLGEEVNRLLDTTDLVSNYHHKMVERISHYSCKEGFMNDTKPVETKRYNFLGRSYRSEIYLEEGGSRIWGISDFLADEECSTLFPRTFVDSIIDSFGVLKLVTEASGASSALDVYEFQSEVRDDKLWPLFDRSLKTLNFYGDMSAQPGSQIKLIKHVLRPRVSSHNITRAHPTPVNGGKVLFFCQVPVKGGTIAFPYSDIQITPKRNMAIFVSSKGGILGRELMVPQYCPALDGQSQIVEIDL